MLANIVEENIDQKPHTPINLEWEVTQSFMQLHAIYRNSDGLHDADALNEFCKLLTLKLFDEEITAMGTKTRFQRWSSLNAEEMKQLIHHLQHQVQEHQSNKFHHQKMYGIEDLLSSPIRLSANAIQLSISTLAAFNFTQSGVDVVGRAFQQFLDKTVRKSMGQYFTPTPIVQMMVNVIAPKQSESVLDPFAGTGHFLMDALSYVNREKTQNTYKASDESKASAKPHYFGIEKNARALNIAHTTQALLREHELDMICSDALNTFEQLPIEIAAHSMDVVVTNPPFGIKVDASSIPHFAEFELAKDKKSTSLEVLAIERATQFLKPGGRIAIVISEGLLSGKRTAYARDWLAQHLKIRAIVSLPIETFRPFGANLKTSIVFARNLHEGETVQSNDQIFLGRIDDIGYTSTGHATNNTEIEGMQKALINFIESEGW